MNLRSPAALTAIGVVATLVLALMVVMALLLTSGAKAVSDNAALIGALVALGGVFTAQMVSIALDDRRTQESRELEAQRAHEAALQNYFEQVGTLLIEQPLRQATPGDNLSTVVRAQTLTVLEGLDPDRKRILLQFLYESGLIHKDKPVVTLSSARLARADLRAAHLRGADLSGTNLIRANLRGADLRGADLRGADLVRANLTSAHLNGANLRGTDLREAILADADLSGTDLTWADLRAAHLIDANLEGANLSGTDLIEAIGSNPIEVIVSGTDLTEEGYLVTRLSGAYLKGAKLIDANLSRAELRKADLRKADLSGTNLIRANLKEVDLRGAKGWTEEQLSEAKSLKGATMPNGRKYED